MTHSRRSFIRNSAVALGAVGTSTFSWGSTPPVGSLRARRGIAPSDRVGVGVIGCNGMGFSDLKSLLKIDGVECRALCDVDASRATRSIETFPSAKVYGDYLFTAID